MPSEHPLLIVILTLVLVLAVYLLALFVTARGNVGRIGLALRPVLSAGRG